MVFLENMFKDVFESLPQGEAFSLPVYKDNPLAIKFENNDNVEVVYQSSEPSLPFAQSDLFVSKILQCRRLTTVSKECKPVYEVTLDVQKSSFTFRAGDTIGIVPKNDADEVNYILDHLDLTSVADSSYTLSLNSSLKSSKIPAHIPKKSSLRHLLTHCVDIRSVLKKLFLLALSRHTKEENERTILEYFCSKQGSTAYQSHILNENLCIIDIFKLFKTCKPPIEVLLAHLPRLLPRPYSIVNSGLKEDKVLKICFSVMSLDNNRKGLTTGQLEKIICNRNNLVDRMNNLAITNGCDIEYKVPIYLRNNVGKFVLPEKLETPLILIGPGTGVSPFIGFLEEREFYIEYADLGEAWLFFGCRHPKLDFIYEEELNEFVKKGVLKKLCTAFSRDENSEMKYVQDALKQNSEDIARLIQSNASIFVCGDLKNMAAQVKDALTQCLVTSGNTLEEATNIICDLHKENRYIVDVWS